MWGLQKRTKAQRVEDALRQAGKYGVTNSRLNRISFRYGAVIFNLRDEGYEIETEKIGKDGLYKYTWRNKRWGRYL